MANNRSLISVFCRAILDLPESGGEVYTYVFNAEHAAEVMRCLRLALRCRRHWVIYGPGRDGGHGREWTIVGPSNGRGPRVCSGTRGRGRKKAAERRAKIRGYDLEPTFKVTYGAAVLDGDMRIMEIPLFRAYRGPKGDRLRGLRKLWLEVKRMVKP